MSRRTGMNLLSKVAQHCSGIASSSQCSSQGLMAKWSQAASSAAKQGQGFSSLTALASAGTFASRGAISGAAAGRSGCLGATAAMPGFSSPMGSQTRWSTAGSNTPVSGAGSNVNAAGQPGAAVSSTESSSDDPTATRTSGGAHSSGVAKTGEDDEEGPSLQDTHYVGPLAFQHKLLKAISITNTAVAFGAAPFIVEFADVSMASRFGLAFSLVFFGVGTTGALHWVARPYVHELKFTAATGLIEVKTTTLFGATRWDTFHVDDVKPLPWNRPVATFMANNKFYYVDIFSFPEGALLKRLTPSEDSVPKGFKDDEDDD